MTREKAMTIIRACGGSAFKDKDFPFKTVEILEAVDTMNDTIDQLRKARKKTRRYKRMFVQLKYAQCNSEKIMEEIKDEQSN